MESDRKGAIAVGTTWRRKTGQHAGRELVVLFCAPGWVRCRFPGSRAVVVNIDSFLKQNEPADTESRALSAIVIGRYEP